MGVDYSPVLYVGKEFAGADEAKDFYEKFFLITSEDENVIAECGLEELLQDRGLDGTILNCYNNNGFVLGINIGSSVRNPERFAEDIGDAIITWEELFGNEPFSIIHTVRIY